MNKMKIIGICLIVLGVVALFYHGITLAVVGGVCLTIGGVVLIVLGSKTKAADVSV